MHEKITIRTYRPSDAQSLADIYYHTIHKVNSKDYTPQQVDAWAPCTARDAVLWHNKWRKVIPFVAETEDLILGFAEFELNGHIDCFYVHHEYQRRGVGSLLMQEIVSKACRLRLAVIFAEVSITAYPFFLKKGFHPIKQQQISLRGVAMTNYIMEKAL